ncbi:MULTISPECIES: hypothetical protein [Streptomyces]|nr:MULTISPECIES: hypothetical protein [Streptomyces]
MRRRRQKAVLAAMALCLGGALTACGSGDDDGYAAVGPIGPERASGTPEGVVPPKGGVSLLPLEPAGTPAAGGSRPRSTDSSAPSTATPSPSSAAPGPSSVPSPAGRESGSGGTEGSTGRGTAPPTGPPTTPEGPDGPGDSGPGSQKPPGSSPPTAPPSGAKPPAGPPVITVGAPALAPTDRRWCEQVTVEFRNTGGRAAASGTVTFGTHIIGALGIDWATVNTHRPLPTPIAAGAARAETYTVCVDAWRVPPGMRIETRDVRADWS